MTDLTERDPQRIRADIERRADHHDCVQAALSSFQVEFAADSRPHAVIRCQEGHQRKLPMLAQLWRRGPEVLFISRIECLPSDQLNLRPWELDQYLRDRSQLSWSDEQLLGWRDRLAELRTGQPALGERWLLGRPPVRVVELVTPDPAPGAGGMWTRCAYHPAAARQWDAADLLPLVRG